MSNFTTTQTEDQKGKPTICPLCFQNYPPTGEADRLAEACEPLTFPKYAVAANGQVFIDGSKVLKLREAITAYRASQQRSTQGEG